MRGSNHFIGAVNFFMLLLSMPIIDGGIWLSSRANNIECIQFLQWPLIAVRTSVMLLSIAGLVGACYHNTLLMRRYLFAMFFVIVALLGFIIFAYTVTDKGYSRHVPS